MHNIKRLILTIFYNYNKIWHVYIPSLNKHDENIHYIQ